MQKGITILVGRVRQVGVAIDQAGQHGHLRKIDDLGVGRNRQALADLLNLVVADENDLIVEHGAGLRINQPAGFDRCHLGSRAGGKRQTQPQH